MTAENPFRDFVIYDHVESCPYLRGRQARMPLRMPVHQVSPQQCDQRLASGERRSGRFVYRTHCEKCQACEPIRLPVSDFVMNRSQRRVLKRNAAKISVEIQAPLVDEQRVVLFNRHRNLRGLAHDGMDIDDEGYQSFLVDTCFNTFEMTFRNEGNLLGAAICDQGNDSLSAVYCYYDPAFSRYSPGVFSILKQIEYCLAHKLRYLYLGFYIAGSEHMSYKENYRPHETLIGAQWRRFDCHAASPATSCGQVCSSSCSAGAYLRERRVNRRRFRRVTKPSAPGFANSACKYWLDFVFTPPHLFVCLGTKQTEWRTRVIRGSLFNDGTTGKTPNISQSATHQAK